jgi:hypothetical protein
MRRDEMGSEHSALQKAYLRDSTPAKVGVSYGTAAAVPFRRLGSLVAFEASDEGKAGNRSG